MTCYSVGGLEDGGFVVPTIEPGREASILEQASSQPTEAPRRPIGRFTLSCQRPVCVDVAGAVARVQKIGRLAQLISGDDLERCTKRIPDVSQKLYTMRKAH